MLGIAQLTIFLFIREVVLRIGGISDIDYGTKYIDRWESISIFAISLRGRYIYVLVQVHPRLFVKALSSESLEGENGVACYCATAMIFN